MNTYLKLMRMGSCQMRKDPESRDYLETSRKSIEEMDTKGYEEYAEKHGHHFTQDLAEHVSRKMQNADGTSHYWSCVDLKGAFDKYGYMLPKTATIGDACYLANMAYSDYYPMLMTEQQCIKYAYLTLIDPDGYEGQAFLRWISDNIGKGIETEWIRYI